MLGSQSTNHLNQTLAQTKSPGDDHIGLLSSDWSHCLSPNGPFDAFEFHYPHLEGDLQHIFERYTANEISLGRAVKSVRRRLPQLLTSEQMDAYLMSKFETYRGVGDLIQWCRRRRVLMMINTTGFLGYFQRILANGLLPPFAVLSAQSMVSFPKGPRDPAHILALSETQHKATHTAAVARRFQIDPRRIILMGDSGGDGPHFQWGAKVGATLIGSMTKPSLRDYCREKGIVIHHRIGHVYAAGEKISIEKERPYHFGDLTQIIRRLLHID
jgi:hypothetical protein